jgi:hypothetical protein
VVAVAADAHRDVINHIPGYLAGVAPVGGGHVPIEWSAFHVNDVFNPSVVD